MGESVLKVLISVHLISLGTAGIFWIFSVKSQQHSVSRLQPGEVFHIASSYNRGSCEISSLDLTSQFTPGLFGSTNKVQVNLTHADSSES